MSGLSNTNHVRSEELVVNQELGQNGEWNGLDQLNRSFMEDRVEAPSYGVLSSVYDEVMGDRTKSIRRFVELLQSHHPQCQSLLEVACGTGVVLESFKDRYEVTGVDLSTDMLERARERLPSIELIQADMTSLELDRKFDAIICVFDSINHVLDWGGWKRAFRAAQQHLNPGGVFIFDAHTIHELERHAAGPSWEKSLSSGTISINVTKSEDKRDVYAWEVILNQNAEDGGNEIQSEVINEVAFPVSDVQRELSELFDMVEIVSFDGQSYGDLEETDKFIAISKIPL